MKKFYILLTFVTIFLALFIVGNLEASTYYIDRTNGNDSNSGTLASPWETISKANSTLNAGDTVYIRAGTYFGETILPKNSGKSSNYISYKNYNGELVTIEESARGADLSGKDYIKVDGISFNKTKSSWIYLEDSNNNIIQNCTFENSKAYTGLILSKNSNYNRILNNKFNTSPASGNANGTSPADHMRIGHGRDRTSSYNVVQGNTFYRTGHASLAIFGPYNIIRDNTFQNKYHTGLGLGNSWQLVEKNRFYDQGDDYKNDPIPASDRLSNPGVQLSWSNHIIRKNIFDNNGASITLYSTNTKDDPSDNRIYNNTMNKAVRVFYGAADNVEGHSNNVIKNNAITNSFDGGGVKSRDKPALIYYYYKQGTNHKWHNNNVYGPIDAHRYTQKDAYPMTFESILSKYSSDWTSGNMAVNPKYKNARIRDFTLQGDSPMIDSGAWLAVVSNLEGSSPVTTFVVDDAKYFYDGWGIPGEMGDQIQTESGKIARIVDVDYNKNTVTVDRAINVGIGEGVALLYSGESPDIGACEYGRPKTGLSAPNNLKILGS